MSPTITFIGCMKVQTFADTRQCLSRPPGILWISRNGGHGCISSIDIEVPALFKCVLRSLTHVEILSHYRRCGLLAGLSTALRPAFIFIYQKFLNIYPASTYKSGRRSSMTHPSYFSKFNDSPRPSCKAICCCVPVSPIPAGT